MDISKYKKLFLQESEERLKTINDSILSLAKAGAIRAEQDSNIDALFRCFHSVKGMAASMGYETVKSLAHKLEGLLDGLRKNAIEINQPIIDTLLKGADMLALSLKNISEDKALNMNLAPLFNEITLHLERSTVPQTAEPKEPLSEPLPHVTLSNTIKVDAGVFDNAIANIGELLKIKSQISGITKDVPDIEFADSIRCLDKSIKELHETILHARMIPLEDLMQSLPRIVYDISKNRGKEIEFSMEGIDINVDRKVLDAAADPLVHIIRNAVDHGIETAEERERLGKPRKGQIKITASRERDYVAVQITDDGRGIDIERVKGKAVSLGVPKERMDIMTRDEVLSLICMPGLSLKKEVTDVSGRGVGMDVVKKNIEAVGGTLMIKSMPDRGTKFILKLPFTTSIIKILMISIDNKLFCLPLSKVESIAEVSMQEIKNHVPAGVKQGTEKGISLFYREKDVPLFDLRKIFNMPEKGLKDIQDVVVLNINNRTTGILIDEFRGVFEAYIKPLPEILRGIRGISGFTVMGDGNPVFLIDAANII